MTTTAPPAWGWKLPYTGRASHVAAAPEYQATTSQVCGLFPYVAGSGTPAMGTPVGRHQLSGELVIAGWPNRRRGHQAPAA